MVQAVDQTFFGVTVRNVIFTLVVRANLVWARDVLGKTQATTVTIKEVKGFTRNGMIAGSYDIEKDISSKKTDACKLKITTKKSILNTGGEVREFFWKNQKRVPSVTSTTLSDQMEPF